MSENYLYIYKNSIRKTTGFDAYFKYSFNQYIYEEVLI